MSRDGLSAFKRDAANNSFDIAPELFAAFYADSWRVLEGLHSTSLEGASKSINVVCVRQPAERARDDDQDLHVDEQHGRCDILNPNITDRRTRNVLEISLFPRSAS